MAIDATRLLVLGATRQEQPATGYAIMRELTSWGVQEWASVNPGTIYGALRSLVVDGLAIEVTGGAAAKGGSHKNSTKYRVTPEGEAAFADLLHTSLWEVSPYRAAPFMAALCFLVELPRKEVSAAIEQRIGGLEASLEQLKADELDIPGSDTKPLHSVEFARLAAARLQGELDFTRSLLERVNGGSYHFLGDRES